MKKWPVWVLLMASGTAGAQSFDFGGGPVASGYTKVTPETLYDSTRGYGFLPGTPITGLFAVRKRNDFVTAAAPFYFSVNLPEGNYDVELLLGDEKGASQTTVKVENRRLMLEDIRTPNRKLVRKKMTVNVRTPNLPNGGKVILKPREKAYRHWDGQLTFEFSGELPKVAALKIRPNKKAVTVFLAGNSTVVDQPYEPFAAWGQMIPRFFEPGKIAVANHAESGESLTSFLASKRWEKVLGLVRPGDYVFIEFAHNDQKQKDLRPFVEYAGLLKRYIQDVRAKGGNPVLVTSMHRRKFDALGHIENTLGDFPEAMRKTAGEEHVPLIDLNAMSKQLWESLGPEASLKAFVHYPPGALPGRPDGIQDNTHFSNYGAYLLAQCVVKGIREAVPELARNLVPDVQAIDPARPMLPEQFHLAASPLVDPSRPDGN